MNNYTRENPADIVVVGGGIVGASVFHAINKYANEAKTVLLERNATAGALNSNETQNSQTLHEGDIESNYIEEKVLKVYQDAQPLKNFVQQEANEGNTIHRVYGKMLFGAGAHDAQTVKERYQRYTKELQLFPDNQLLGPDEINTIEPELMRDRDPNQPVAAYYNPAGYAIDFGKAAQALVRKGLDHGGENAEALFSKSMVSIKRHSTTGDLFEILLDDGSSIFTRSINLSMGGFTEKVLKDLGYNKDTGIISMEGNYYQVKPESFQETFNNKVYGIQDTDKPFARAHLDPEWDDPNSVRIGPTALPTYYLEKKKRNSFRDYLKIMSHKDTKTYRNLLTNKKYFSHMFRTLMYKLPGIGPKLYINNELNYYLPWLKANDIDFLPGAGGTRPIEADRTKHTLNFGGGETFGINENLKGNKTPSPGASQAMAIGARDAITFAHYTSTKQAGITIDIEQMRKDGFVV